MTKNDQKAWNPAGIALISILISFVLGGILHVLNYSRLGEKKLKKIAIFAVLIPLVVLFLIILKLPNLNWYGILGYNLLISYYFYHSQKNLFAKHVAAGRKHASWKYPIIFSLIFLALIYGSIFAYDSYQENKFFNKFDQANSLMDAGHFPEAEQIFVEIINDDGAGSGVFYNLAMVYDLQGETNLAIQQLEKLLEIDPSNKDARNFLRSLKEGWEIVE